MKTETFEVKLDARVIPLVTKRRQDVAGKLRELAVIELFREGRLSSGKAADILGLERLEFFALLHQLGVPFFDQDPAELRQDVARA